MSNSNFNITKVVVDPTSQEITNLEINGKAFESGSEPNLEKRFYDADNQLNVESLFWQRPGSVIIQPSAGYDGLERITIDHAGLTGYPGEGLEIQEGASIQADFVSTEQTITIPEGQAWTGTIVLYPGITP